MFHKKFDKDLLMHRVALNKHPILECMRRDLKEHPIIFP